MTTTSEFDKCSVCLKDYDTEEHTPVTFRQCNHTIGKRCADEILKTSRACPVCLNPLPKRNKKRYPTYSVNQLLRDKVKYESNFERCTVHQKPLDLYCENDKCKICMGCLRMNGDHGHSGHKVSCVDDLKQKIEQVQEVYDQSEKDYDAFFNQGKSLLGKRRLECRQNLEIIDKPIKIIVLEQSLRARAIIDSEEREFKKDFGEESKIQKEIKSKVNLFKDLKSADLKDIMDCNIQEFNIRLTAISEKTLETLKENIDKKLNLLAPLSINEEDTRLAVRAPEKISHLHIQSYISFELCGDALSIKASDVLNPDVKINFEEWENNVKQIELSFTKFNFNEEDLELLNYIIYRLQSQIKKIGLLYEDISEASFKTRFENHLIDFSRLVFSSSLHFEEIKLFFIRANGIDRLLRCFTEKLEYQPSSLKTIKIESESSDLTENSLIAFSKVTGSSLKCLKGFRFVSKFSRTSFENLCNLALELPSLERFVFINREDADSRHMLPISFIENSLHHMKGLEICTIDLQCPQIKALSLNKLFDTAFEQFPETEIEKMSEDRVVLSYLPEL